MDRKRKAPARSGAGTGRRGRDAPERGNPWANVDGATLLNMLSRLGRDHLWFTAIVDQVSDYLFVKDRESRFLLANSAVARDLGTDVPASLIGHSDLELHPPEIGGKFYADEQEIMRTGISKVDYEEYLIRKDGTRRWFSSSKYPLRTPGGEVVGIIGVARDVTDRKKASLLREGQAKVLEMIASSAPLDGVLSKLVSLIEEQLDDVAGSIRLLDEQGGYLKQSAAPSLPEAFRDAIERVAIGAKAGSCGAAACTGEPVFVEDIATDPLWSEYAGLALEHGLRSCWTSPIVALDGRVLGTFTLYSGHVHRPEEFETRLVEETIRIAAIAIERHESEQKIHFLANSDPLTGLPNRNMLGDRLEAMLAETGEPNPGVAVVFFDLDKFKAVNDGLGHAAGDKLLRVVAERTKGHMRRTDMLTRFGGDEFVILLTGVNSEATDEIETILQRIRRSISEPIVIDGQLLHVTSSMGVAVYPDDGEDAETLLKNADAAMYKAKEGGRNNHQFYNSAMNEEARRSLSLIQDMTGAIDDEQFFLEYQPIFDLRSMTVVGTEALLRWQHPVYGRLSPDQFIPIAEESGLIVPLGRRMLDEACRQNVAWQEAGGQSLKICVNVSVRQFSDPGLINDISKVLERTAMPAECLELEVKEGLLMQQPEKVAKAMNLLRAMGIGFTIDDFGTGYSSLGTLRSFPLGKLKIGRAFVQDMAASRANTGVAKAIITMGHELDMRVIVEGVETLEQLNLLKDLGCDEAQGFYIGRPQSIQQIESLLAIRGVLDRRAASA